MYYQSIHVFTFDESYALFDAFCEYAAYKNSQIRRYAQNKDCRELMKNACKELKSILSIVKKNCPSKELSFVYNYARFYYKKFE